MDNDKDKDKDKDKRGDRAFRKSKLMNTGRCVRTVGIMQTNQMKHRNHYEEAFKTHNKVYRTKKRK